MSLVGKLIRAGINSVDDLARQVMPKVLMTGDSVLIERTTNALRNMGARVPSLPGAGVIGSRQLPAGARPAPSALRPEARGLVGQPKPGALNQEMQSIVDRARQVAPTTPAPGVRGVSPLVQNRAPAALAEAPTPPVRYPGAAPQGETARQITMLKPGPGEVGSMGTRLTYRPGTQGIEGRLGSTTYGEGAEIGASSMYPRVSPRQADLTAPSLRNAAEEAGMPLFTSTPVSPRPAFGAGAGPSPMDRIADLAFGNRGARGVGGGVLPESAPGGALVRSPRGEVVEELMIDPVRVREIFEASPELLGSLRNATGGVQTADLGSLLSNPAVRAAIGAGGLGSLGYGIASMMDTNRTGETTAGSPPTTPLFTEDGRTPLGDIAPAAPVNAPATGNIDPSAPAPMVTSGDRESVIREALQQAAPNAAAVMRAAEPMSPEKYRSIEEYAAAKQAYAQAKPELQNLMRFMEGQSPTAGGGLAMWAAAHPDLAYRYQQQALKNPAANQQSAESITTTQVTSPIGSELPAAAAGNAAATAQAVTNPSQGAFDMVDATRPQVQPNLQRVQDFIQRQGRRSAMYAGYSSLADI